MDKEFLQNLINDLTKIYQVINLTTVSGQQNTNYIALSLNMLQGDVEQLNKKLQEEQSQEQKIVIDNTKKEKEDKSR